MPIKGHGIAELSVGVLLLAGCASPQVAGTPTFIGTPMPTSFVLNGTLTLTHSATALHHCLGTDAYDDIRPGTGVKVTDAAGVIVGLGTLGASYSTPGRCFYPFTVKDVPTGSKFYSVEISHRGAFDYTEKEAVQTICLSLGG